MAISKLWNWATRPSGWPEGRPYGFWIWLTEAPLPAHLLAGVGLGLFGAVVWWLLAHGFPKAAAWLVLMLYPTLRQEWLVEAGVYGSHWFREVALRLALTGTGVGLVLLLIY
ncbi:MAG: hypothetical protein KatS3mg109_1357 [Pirellulaceae bacterium]|nr:MAG: hypothetical protein KatS3mg109_1219 [Pirellulaceae bacterium]GIW90925.1 MAG: hypothetical protein KatS3mg109_1357 [Pirellulaceae bacterium]